MHDSIIRRLDYLARSVEILKTNQRDILALLTVVLKNSSPAPINLADIVKEFNFPLQSTREVDQFNDALKDKLNIAKLVSPI